MQQSTESESDVTQRVNNNSKSSLPSAGYSIHCRQGSVQHLDRHVMAGSSTYCGSLTDDDCRITFKGVSPSISLLPLFPIPVTPVSSAGSEQSFAHAFFFSFFAISVSPLQVLPLSVYPHRTVVKFKFSEILPEHYSLHTSFKSTGHPGVFVLISASHYV